MTPLDILLLSGLSISLTYICYRERNNWTYICKKREKPMLTIAEEYPQNIFIRPNHIELIVS